MPAASILHFGEFEIDLRTAELRKKGTRIRLQEQPFQILRMLLERRGEVVLREEIRKKLWPNDTIVEFAHSISAAVRRLRDALGDSAEKPRYIETVGRRGYRFIAEIAGELGHAADQACGPEPLTGQTISHYRVLEKLGSGGMGVVYKATDLNLGREVALKLLSEAWVGNAAALERFQREARAASALNHPNICTIHGIEDLAGQPAIVMELLEGETLGARLTRGALPPGELVSIGASIAEALGAAHSKSIIHRDIKPTNIFLTSRGVVKVLDFGLAKRTRDGVSPGRDLTRMGTPMGSLRYMSPEQARGEELDPRSDLFSLGVVLYEMATGRLPFDGEHPAAALHSTIYDEPRPPRELRHDLPAAMERVILRCLAKKPGDRYPSATALVQDLAGCQDRDHPWRLPRIRILIPVLAAFAVLMSIAGLWYYRRGASARWAREVAIPEATRQVDAGEEATVFPLLYKALQILPQDPVLNRLRREISHPFTIRSTPPGASVYLKPYMNPDAPWLYIGHTPLNNFMLAMGYYRWKLTKPGFRTVEGAGGIQNPSIDFVFDPEGSVPPDMVHVPRGTAAVFNSPPLRVDDYWMDTYEVTNGQFKAFVDGGGYRNPRYWRQPFIKDGRVLSWEEAMAQFRDATGRPGPSTWQVDACPPGQEDFPVGGVSWYEAAAYAEFANKQLPTIYHWLRAANYGIYSDMLQFSNYDTSGPVRAGSMRGIGSFGTYDMAGNVKEWCWNGAGSRRYILGGGWNETRPYYIIMDKRSPFDRSPANGFRCVRYRGGPVPDTLTHPVDTPWRDYAAEKPVPDSVFRILANLYAYDRGELGAVTESVDKRSPYWRAERIAFNTAYDGQRMAAWLYLPGNAKPPYQTIVFAPAGHARTVGSIDEAEIRRMDFLIRSGRAVLFPVYQGTFERRANERPGPAGERDLEIKQCKDLFRSVDYLQTRGDIAHEKFGLFAISGGARMGLVAVALEPRIKAAVLAEAGFVNRRKPPEVDEINFAPRIRIPVLMLNGRYSLPEPVQNSQIPLFRTLGTPAEDKRHVLLEAGSRGPATEYIKDTLDWFDRYLGPVTR